MAKYVRLKEELHEGFGLNANKIFKVISETRECCKVENYGDILKSHLEDVTILDIDLQRVNNIVIGTLNYMSDNFKITDELQISNLSYNKSLFLHGCSISLTKEHKGLSDSIYFDSAQEAQDYIDKFTKIIDDINMSQEKRYKINYDKVYSEEDVKKLKEFGIDFIEVK